MCSRQWLPLCNDNLTLSPISIRRSPQQWSPILIHVLYLTVNSTVPVLLLLHTHDTIEQTRNDTLKQQQVTRIENATRRKPLVLDGPEYRTGARAPLSYLTARIKPLKRRTILSHFVCLFACDEIDPLHN